MDVRERIRRLKQKAVSSEFTVRCQGCGKVLDPADKDTRQIEYVKTKRGSEMFFHTECMDKVWSRKIV